MTRLELFQWVLLPGAFALLFLGNSIQNFLGRAAGSAFLAAVLGLALWWIFASIVAAAACGVVVFVFCLWMDARGYFDKAAGGDSSGDGGLLVQGDGAAGLGGFGGAGGDSGGGGASGSW